MPHAFYEVEHTTDFHNSLLKFVRLQDFRARFGVVADGRRKAEYQSKITNPAFKPIEERVNFIAYEDLSKHYDQTTEVSRVRIGF
jgi:hypothetical protein